MFTREGQRKIQGLAPVSAPTEVFNTQTRSPHTPKHEGPDPDSLSTTVHHEAASLMKNTGNGSLG